MRVLLTGATGFTGGFVLRALKLEGASVRCLVRPDSDLSRIGEGADLAYGDVGDAASMRKALDGIDAVINTASLGFGHAPVLVSSIRESGVRRAVFISTTAIFTKLNAPSRTIRMAAEKTITDSPLDYTILRPTMIYGTARDRNMVRLIRFMRRSPVVPVLGSGTNLQQPVYVADVAAAAVAAVRTPAAIHQAYNISGAKPVTFNEVIETVAALMKRRVWKLHLPAGPAVAMLQQTERAGLRLPIKSEQILRLNEDKAFDHNDASRDFGYAPLTFQEGMRRELAELGYLR